MAKQGNPAFGRKATVKAEKPKDHRFMLTQEHGSLKPVNNKTGVTDHNPFPPMFFVPNEGVAYDEDTKEIRRWRYIYGYSSIWVEDQEKPKPSKQQLESPDNVIMFKDGHLRVAYNNKALFKALSVQDMFEGNTNKVNEIPVQFRLINEEAEFNKMFDMEDKAFEAQKSARECTDQEMMPIAAVLGIDVSDGIDYAPRIRKHFILKAKQNPVFFLREFVNPKNKIKYMVSEALRNNIVSSTDIEGKLVYVGSGAIIMNINPNADIAEQVAQNVISRNEKAVDFYEQLKLTEDTAEEV